MPLKQAFKDELCSAWYNACTVKPVRKGWYEARGSRINGFVHLFWTGKKWQYFGARHVEPDFPNFGAYIDDEWRGITEDEHKRARRGPKPGQRVGDRMGLLTAIQPEYSLQNGGIRWRFRCDCGRICVSPMRWVRDGNTASCGCQQHKQRSIAVERPWDNVKLR